MQLRHYFIVLPWQLRAVLAHLLLTRIKDRLRALLFFNLDMAMETSDLEGMEQLLVIECFF